MIGQAACRDEDPELFRPVGDSAPARAQTAAAEAVCHHARVKFDCLTWALKASKDADVWGGVSEAQRRTIGRRPEETTGLRGNLSDLKELALTNA
jgi:WhiB family redox-sensing transcriptional regulator